VCHDICTARGKALDAVRVQRKQEIIEDSPSLTAHVEMRNYHVLLGRISMLQRYKELMMNLIQASGSI